ncbi:uncharacterized protein KZ484_021295 [Pholidichthys leucotaenia]
MDNNLEVIPYEVLQTFSIVGEFNGTPIYARVPSSSLSTSVSPQMTPQVTQEESGYVKKPPNAFMIFLREQRPLLKAELNCKFSSTLNVILGERWRSLSREQKARYFELAEKEKLLHEQKYPNWSPIQNHGKKRKRNKDHPSAESTSSSHEEETSQAKRRKIKSPHVVSEAPISCQAEDMVSSESGDCVSPQMTPQVTQEENGYIKKPPNAFMVFVKEQRPLLKTELNCKFSSNLNVILGERWTSLSREQKARYFELAEKEKRLHEQKYPNWSPSQNHGKTRKRNKDRPWAKSTSFSHEEETSQAKRRKVNSPHVVSEAPISCQVEDIVPAGKPLEWLASDDLHYQASVPCNRTPIYARVPSSSLSTSVSPQMTPQVTQEENGYIKKPPNAFMVFVTEQRPLLKAELNCKFSSNLNAILGERWGSLSTEQKARYFELAEKAKRLHEQKYPNWSPSQNHGKKRKRNKDRPLAKSASSSHEEETSQAKRREIKSPHVVSEAPISCQVEDIVPAGKLLEWLASDDLHYHGSVPHTTPITCQAEDMVSSESGDNCWNG